MHGAMHVALRPTRLNGLRVPSKAQTEQIRSIDVARLLRRWAETYSVLRANGATSFIAPRGAVDALDHVRELRLLTAVTGSFAAVRRAPHRS